MDVKELQHVIDDNEVVNEETLAEVTNGKGDDE